MPYMLPRQPGFRDYIPELTKDVLLAALTKGMSLISAVPKYAAMSQQPQGVSGPMTQGGSFLSPQALQGYSQQLNQGMSASQLPSGVSSRQSGIRLGIPPDLDPQLKQAQLQQTNANTAWLNRMPGGSASVNPQTGQPQLSAGSSSSFYQVGDIVERAGKRYRIVGYDTDGMPMVDDE